MSLFLFTNFFPFKKAEPFLVNEYEFTKKYFSHISVLALYGKEEDLILERDKTTFIHKPILSSISNKKELFLKGIFNFSPLSYHLKELFRENLFFKPKKFYWHMISLLITRVTLSSTSYKSILAQINNESNPVLYFYWGDNLCWTIPYLKKQLGSKKVKIVVRFHRTDLYEYLKADHAPLRMDILNACDLIVPISKDGENYLREKYPSITSKIFLSRLGVFDLGLNAQSSDEVKHIISVSFIIPVKRVESIFEVLQKTKTKIHWHHFGDGSLSNELNELIKGRRKDLQITLHGHVENKKLLAFYQTQPLDLFINLSASEGLPVSIMEALSFGVPVIATNVGGTSDLVNDKVGKLIPADFNSNELAILIDQTLNTNSETYSDYRKNARRSFEENVSANTNYTMFYTKILS